MVTGSPSSATEDVESEGIDPAMAAAMGFSNFGSQNTGKRRRFNPRADHTVIASGAGLSQSPPAKRAATGVNATALPPRTQGARLGAGQDSHGTAVGTSGLTASAMESPAGKNTDEIDLDDEGEEDNENPEPQYIDTSRSPRPLEDEDLPPDGTNGYGTASTPFQAKGPDLSLPARPNFSSAPAHGRPDGGRGGSRRGRGGASGGGGGGRVREDGKPWWDGYYDPSSNTNPWERLEQAMGIGAKGVWLEWGHTGPTS